MSIVNGVWHDAVTDLPKDHESVLAVKQLKNGRREEDEMQLRQRTNGPEQEAQDA